MGPTPPLSPTIETQVINVAANSAAVAIENVDTAIPVIEATAKAVKVRLISHLWSLLLKQGPLNAKVKAVLEVWQVQVPERIRTPPTEKYQPETVQEVDKEESRLETNGKVDTNSNMMTN